MGPPPHYESHINIWICIVTCRCDCRGGVSIGDLIYCPLMHSRLVNTIYRSLTHTDQCPQSITVSTSRFLATVFNTGYNSLTELHTQVSHIKSSLDNRTFNWVLLQLTLLFTASRTELPNWLCNISARTTYKQPVSNINYIVVCIFIAAGTCLPSRCSETFIVYRVTA
jgi:uncharacterized membrane protein